NVKILRKKELTFIELLVSLAASTEEFTPDSESQRALVDRGNCIPLAIARLVGNCRGVADLLTKRGARALADQVEGVRSYDVWSQHLAELTRAAPTATLPSDTRLRPRYGLHIPASGSCLLHAENNGVPHCILATISDAGLVECWTGLRVVVVSRENVSVAFARSSDRSTVVTYTPQVNPPRDGELHFLHLRAGAFDDAAPTTPTPCILPEASSTYRPRRRLNVKTRPEPEPIASYTAPTSCPTPHQTDEDVIERAVTTHVGEELLVSLNLEVSLAMSVSY
ncbi:MAG: hypothetical protein GY772_25330, partial [bacterium]|nr:hypothetical protein [bacterium]